MAQIARKGVFYSGAYGRTVYETKIIIPSRKGQGLTGLSVGDKGPSVVDRVTNVAIGLLVLFLVYSVIEPFWSSSASETQLVQLEASFNTLSEKLKAYEQQHGPYTSSSLKEMEGRGLDEEPTDPWGNLFIIDPFWKRIICTGPNGKLDTKVLMLGNEVSQEASDDKIFYYQASGVIWYTVKGENGCSVMRMNADGTSHEAVGGEAFSDAREASPSPNLKKLAVSASTSTGRHIIICNDDYSYSEYVTTVGENRWPTWTANGVNVVYESKRATGSGKEYQLFLYDVAMRQERQVTRGDVSFRTPRCHPTDNDKVVCIGIKKGSKLPKMYLLSIDGFTLSSKPLNSSKKPEKAPVWHCDGKQLLFLSKMGGNIQVFAENIHNRAIRKLSYYTDKKPVALDASPFDDRYVVSLKQADGTYLVAVADPATEKFCPVFTSQETIASLRWTP